MKISKAHDSCFSLLDVIIAIAIPNKAMKNIGVGRYFMLGEPLLNIHLVQNTKVGNYDFHINVHLLFVAM